MEDDFNTAFALSSIFDLATAINRMIEEATVCLSRVLAGRDLLLSQANVLGLLMEDVEAFIGKQAAT